MLLIFTVSEPFVKASEPFVGTFRKSSVLRRKPSELRGTHAKI